ncbi:MAG: OmpA family protein [Dehalococcoidia bacterium]|nr:OmpA family protein [Dehalococcoidia bacterium]MCA9825569.1 OmpA family protein [Dehalococcoidia bacterium]MCA9845718.1 OmpA family protein [Dehalococcoidia bacterium]
MSRKAPEPAHAENHERWIVSYADMVTLLFALFVVLYAISDTNPEKLEVVRTSLDRAFDVGVLTSTDGASPVFEGGGGLAPSLADLKLNSLKIVTEDLTTFASDTGIIGKVQVRGSADGVTISLADDLLFASGSAALRPGSQDVLQRLAALLNEMPNEIRVEGHTDTVPVNSDEYATNWELSTARATTVLRYLTDEAGVDPARMSVAGYADTRPVGDNSTPEGRALNRRADIVIVYPTEAEIIERFGALEDE